MNTEKINKKVIIVILLTLLLTAGLYKLIRNADLYTGVRLVFLIKGVHEDARKSKVFSTDRKRGIRGFFAQKFHTGDRTLTFYLLPHEIRDIILTPAAKGEPIEIKRIQLVSILDNQTWNGTDLETVFHLKKRGLTVTPNHDTTSITTQKPWISLTFTQTAKDRLNQMGHTKTIYYLLLIPAAFIIFFILYYFDPRGLKIFASPKSLTSMSLLFILVLVLPMLSDFTGITVEKELTEKRRMETKPVYRFDQISQYAREYTLFYNDYFAFRSILVYLHNRFKVKGLDVSPLPRVLKGKGNWLFLHKVPPRPSSVDYYRAVEPFTTEDLEQWKNLLEGRRRHLAAMGIHYLYVIVPNKNTIYPEYMPAHIRKANPISRMDQLLDYLRQHSQVETLDLRPALLSAKDEYPVYSQTDTHWNDFGAYIGYCEIMKALSRFFPQVRPMPRSRFQIATQNWAGGDLAIMLSLHKDDLREDIVHMTATPPLTATGGQLKPLSLFVKPAYTENPDGELPNLVMVNDSFYKKIRPFLAEHFKRAVYIWDWDMNYYPNVIQQENPKIVIDEMAERFLLDKMPVNPPGM